MAEFETHQDHIGHESSDPRRIPELNQQPIQNLKRTRTDRDDEYEREHPTKRPRSFLPLPKHKRSEDDEISFTPRKRVALDPQPLDENANRFTALVDPWHPKYPAIRLWQPDASTVPRSQICPSVVRPHKPKDPHLLYPRLKSKARSRRAPKPVRRFPEKKPAKVEVKSKNEISQDGYLSMDTKTGDGMGDCASKQLFSLEGSLDHGIPKQSSAADSLLKDGFLADNTSEISFLEDNAEPQMMAKSCSQARSIEYGSVKNLKGGLRDLGPKSRSLGNTRLGGIIQIDEVPMINAANGQNSGHLLRNKGPDEETVEEPADEGSPFVSTTSFHEDEEFSQEQVDRAAELYTLIADMYAKFPQLDKTTEDKMATWIKELRSLLRLGSVFEVEVFIAANGDGSTWYSIDDLKTLEAMMKFQRYTNCRPWLERKSTGGEVVGKTWVV